MKNVARVAACVGILVWISTSAARAEAQSPELGLALDLSVAHGLDGETTEGNGIGLSASPLMLGRVHPVISLAAGAHTFVLFGEPPAPWIGTRVGARVHWGSLFGMEPDGWIDVMHAYGTSGPVSAHGIDVGLGIAFPLTNAVGVGPSARLLWFDDPDGTDPWIVVVGVSFVGWPGRPERPRLPRTRPGPPRYVAPGSLAQAHARTREIVARQAPSWLRFDVELAAARGVDAQSLDALDFGGGLAAHVELLPLPWLGVHVGASGLVLAGRSGPAVLWAGSRLGLRLHWTEIVSLAGDGWIDLHHVYGTSGDVAAHGGDIGVGYSFDGLPAVRVGPFARFAALFDPDGTPAMVVQLGVQFAMEGGGPSPGPGNVEGDMHLDGEDRCAEILEGQVEDPLNPGCPLLDRDHDGVLDDRDVCDTEPAGDFPDHRRERVGCPLPDSDGDGVVDEIDFCPDGAPPEGDDDVLRDGCTVGEHPF